MIEYFEKLKDENTKFSKNIFKQVIQGYIFIHIQNMNEYENEIKKIEQNINDTQLIIFYTNNNFNKKSNGSYLILGLEKALIFLHTSSLIKVQSLLTQNTKLQVCFLEETKQILKNNNIKFSNHEIELDQNIIYDINKLKESIFAIEMRDIWSFISPCISCYLITKSHMKLNINRLEQFSNLVMSSVTESINQISMQMTIQDFYKYSVSNLMNKFIVPKIFNKSEYLELRIVGTGSEFKCYLIYLIERGELCVIKIPYRVDNEKTKLIRCELCSYSKFVHSFLCKFYGITNGTNYVVIEYIKGRSLRDINNINLTFDEKITIIFELICAIMAFHQFGFVIRDLKPDNVLIDEHKNAILIDFDRTKTIDVNVEHTKDLGDCSFVDPEINRTGMFTCKSDIYSLGNLIKYLMDKEPDNCIKEIKSIIEWCTYKIPEKRPSIKDLYNIFSVTFQSQNNLINLVYNGSIIFQQNYLVTEAQKYALQMFEKSYINQNHPETLFNFGNIYYEGKYVTRDINKAIHYFSLAANQNHPHAQYKLGFIYHEGKYVTRDIDKAIHYYSLAANQNHPEAQLNLGFIYHEGKYVTRDINKAIHYYSLAANQNHPQAQFYLGTIYYVGKYVTCDINKAIHYFSLAANQNHPQAQFILGLIYEESKYVTCDISKAIKCFSLAANQNIPEAQFKLGIIYEESKYVTCDINKAIKCFSLAANQNIPEAQFKLGIIYYAGEYATRDINKAIHYFSLAANQNHPQAQFILGLIYEESKYVTCDISKAIKCFSLAANQNIPEAQFKLGIIYYAGEYATRDINKAIHYFSLAANQNHPHAQFNLGVIYIESKYVTRNINKAIHYFSLAANQNDPEAQFNLGFIYHEGKYVTCDIDKAIHYYSLAANQNHPEAQLNLGFIYHEGKYVTRDINKAIHYYSLAANQNHPQAQSNLGVIYSEGKYVTRDIYKAIHYFSLAANQNYPGAQFNLGFIYYEGKYVTRDIDKAIHYYSLAANQNLPQAQSNLGFIYYEGKYVTRDINKAIHYFSLAANQNIPQAQFNLGVIYYEGKYVTSDINKAIYYYSLAANQNYPQAQFYLGIIYYSDYYPFKNIKKGRYYIMLSSKNGNVQANFAHGFLLHEGKNIEQNITEAVHYYKEASSFNNQYAKNNLGIIYKHGYDNIKGRAGNAIVYFEEAIRQRNDYLSMYNLAHIHMYDDTIKQDIDKSIDLLFRSSKYFEHSIVLLILALCKRYEFNCEIIKQKISNNKNITSNGLINLLHSNIPFFKSNYKMLYDFYRSKDFVYNLNLRPILSSDLEKKVVSVPKYPNAKNISSSFYDGFGRELL